MPSFEYFTFHIRIDQEGEYYGRFDNDRNTTYGLDRILNRIGLNGWELISLEPFQWEEDFLPENGRRATRVMGYLAAFKRIP